MICVQAKKRLFCPISQFILKLGLLFLTDGREGEKKKEKKHSGQLPKTRICCSRGAWCTPSLPGKARICVALPPCSRCLDMFQNVNKISLKRPLMTLSIISTLGCSWF